MITRRILAPVWLAMAIAFAAPAFAGPAEDIAAASDAIEAALSDRKSVEAETLALETLALAEETLGEKSLPVANLHRLLGDALFYQDRFEDADPHYRAALALREELLGSENLDTAQSFNDLALNLKQMGQFVEAEPLYRRVVEIRLALLGPGDPATARARFALARIFDAMQDYASAAAEMGAAVDSATLAYGPDDPTTAEWMGEHAAMLHDADDFAAAETAYLLAIRQGERAFPAGDTRLAYVWQGLGNLYYQTNRAAEAVPLLRAALATRDATLGPDSPAALNTVDRLARALWQLDEVVESEALFRRLLDAREASDGPDSPAVADALRWLGRAASAQDHDAEAEILFKRALEISETALGADHVLTGFDLIALGQLYSGQQRFTEARPLLQRAVTILSASGDYRSSASAGRMALSFLELATGNTREAISLAQLSLDDTIALSGPSSREVADVMLILGGYRFDNGEAEEAERLVRDALTIYRKQAPESRALIRATSQLGRIRQSGGHIEEAITLHREALDALAARYGADSAELEPAIADMGSAQFQIGDFAGAADYFARAVAIIENAAAIDAAATFKARTGAVEDQAIARAATFDFLIKSNYRRAETDPTIAAALAADSFALAQRVTESQAAGALAQMAARQASGSGTLAGLVRERQDLVADWQRRDAALTAALGETAPNRTAIAALRAALAKADAAITKIDETLATGFPGFAALQRPAPLALADVQARLADNEVLLFFADTTQLGTAGFETYLWAVPKTGTPRWQKLPRSSGELSGAVREFRVAMGVTGETRGPNVVAQAGGADRVGRVLKAGSEIHNALFAGILDMTDGKDLVIVPSKSLSALPFHALVAALPAAAAEDRFRDAHWLARDHAITILPTVASLALTPALTDAGDRKPYVAFANPLLVGSAGEDRRAFSRTACGPGVEPNTTVQTADLPPLDTLFVGAVADADLVRALPPLPETTDEVCAIAEVLDAAPDDLHLAADATESMIKKISVEGTLADAAILHFATHGLVSGDLLGLAEPAIVLTPPSAGDRTDDGLLTASEVTTLKLDADWVILSACNTAASDGGGEALSGLARAFFYAGARALLVSHWPVNSASAVRLTTTAFAELETNPAIGRAEALRRAMVAEIDAGGPAADPSAWAPFILVGANR